MSGWGLGLQEVRISWVMRCEDMRLKRTCTNSAMCLYSTHNEQTSSGFRDSGEMETLRFTDIWKSRVLDIPRCHVMSLRGRAQTTQCASTAHTNNKRTSNCRVTAVVRSTTSSTSGGSTNRESQEREQQDMPPKVVSKRSGL